MTMIWPPSAIVARIGDFSSLRYGFVKGASLGRITKAMMKEENGVHSKAHCVSCSFPRLRHVEMCK